MSKGFIYVNQNPAMPGLLKIGVTEKVPTARANELYTTGVPEPFTVEYYCLVEDAKGVEREVHRRLDAQRNLGNREFFRVALDHAIQEILQVCSPEHQWRRPLNTIETLSRDYDPSEEEEMNDFVAAAMSRALDGSVKKLFYDSNSCTCSITLADKVTEISPVARQIFNIAQQTLSQFEWYGCVYHGRGMVDSEAEF